MSEATNGLNWSDTKTPPKDFKFKTEVNSVTEPLIIINEGKAIIGYFHRYNVDINALHVQAKAGDGLFVDLEFTPLPKAEAWIFAKDALKTYQKPEKENSPAKRKRPARPVKAEAAK